MKVLCVGRTLIDVIAEYTDRIPPTFSVKILDDIRIRPGGGAAITADIFRGLHHDVTSIGYVGDDLDGQYLLKLVERNGISTSHILTKSGFGTLKNIVATDERGDAHYLMSRDDESQFSLADLERIESLSKFDLVHISTFNQLVDENEEPLATWLEFLRDLNPGVVVSVDTSKLEQFSGRVIRIAPYVDYFFGNRFELQRIACEAATNRMTPHSDSEIAEEIIDLGVRKAVVMKLAHSGAYFFSRADSKHVSAFQVPKVRNENGAGDVFCAAFMHYEMQRIPIAECVERANLFSAYHIAHGLTDRDGEEIPVSELEMNSSVWTRSVTNPSGRSRWECEQKVFGFAERFDLTRKMSPADLRSWIERINQWGQLTSSSIVVDAGCGTGRFSVPIMESTGCSVTGIDISEEMLRLAKAKSDQVSWRRMDLCNIVPEMPDQIESIDCIWCSSVLSQVKEQFPAILAQFVSLLRPGGRLLLRFTCRELIKSVEWFQYFQKAKEAAMYRFPSLGTVITHVESSGLKVLTAELVENSQLLSVPDFRERFMSGGFSWNNLYSEDELLECVESMIAGTQSERIPFERPTYFLCAEKPSI